MSDMISEKSQLDVYSAGAVAPPLLDAVEFFEKEFNTRCDVRVGKPSELLDEIEQSASCYAKTGRFLCYL